MVVVQFLKCYLCHLQPFDTENTDVQCNIFIFVTNALGHLLVFIDIHLLAHTTYDETIAWFLVRSRNLPETDTANSLNKEQSFGGLLSHAA